MSNQTEDIYIGSTSQRLLSERLAKHKCDYKRSLSGNKKSTITSYTLLKFDDIQITFIGHFPCEDKHELEARERFYIDNTNCINTVIPTRTDKEYRTTNRDNLTQQKKEWRTINKEPKQKTEN